MVQNKPLCTHNPALMIFSSQSGLLYVPSFTYHFDAYSRKMMSLLFKAFFFSPRLFWVFIVVCRLGCGMWDLGSPNKN